MLEPAGTSATGRRWLWWALGLGSALRLLWCAYAARTPVGLHDPGLYRFLAERLVDGHGYSYIDGPTAYYPPGLPFLLVVPLWLFDRVPGLDDPATAATVLVNLVASVAAVGLAWRLGGRLGGSRAAALAAMAVALWPNLVLHSAVALTETPSLVVVLGLAVLLVEGFDETGPSVRRTIAVGAVLGAGLLLRPVLLPVLPALLLLWRWSGASWAAAARHAAVATAVAVAVVLPWVVRNAVQMDTVTLSLNTGDNLCIGHQPGADGSFLPTEHCLPAGFDAPGRPTSEVRRDRVNREQAITHLRGHLTGEPGQVVRRAWNTVFSDHDALLAIESFGEDRFLGGSVRSVLRWASDLAYWAVVAAVAVTLPGLLRGGDRRFWVLLVLVAAVLLPPLLTFGDPRFKVPATPLLAVLAAAGVVAAGRRRARG